MVAFSVKLVLQPLQMVAEPGAHVVQFAAVHAERVKGGQEPEEVQGDAWSQP